MVQATSTGPSPMLVMKSFVKQFYTMLHTDPHSLYRFYNEESTLTHGDYISVPDLDKPVSGQQAIREKLLAHNFDDCRVELSFVDCQKSVDNGVLLQVHGHMTNRDSKPRRFTQTFFLVPSNDRYYVHNDILRFLDPVEGGPDTDRTHETASPSVDQRGADDDQAPQRSSPAPAAAATTTTTTATPTPKPEVIPPPKPAPAELPFPTPTTTTTTTTPVVQTTPAPTKPANNNTTTPTPTLSATTPAESSSSSHHKSSAPTRSWAGVLSPSPAQPTQSTTAPAQHHHHQQHHQSAHASAQQHYQQQQQQQQHQQQHSDGDVSDEDDGEDGPHDGPHDGSVHPRRTVVPWTHSVYVGGLPSPNIDLSVLKRQFLVHGEVTSVYVPPGKTYAFVNYTSDTATQAALAANNFKYHDIPLIVSPKLRNNNRHNNMHRRGGRFEPDGQMRRGRGRGMGRGRGRGRYDGPGAPTNSMPPHSSALPSQPQQKQDS